MPSRRFPADPAILAEVRRWLRGIVDGRGLSDETTEDIVLAGSEACTNAIRHSGSAEFEIRCQAARISVEIEVTDQGVYRQRVRTPGEQGGMGIPLMMALMDTVEISEGRADEPGTRVRLVKKLRTAADGVTQGQPAHPTEFFG